jgi:hypothetical protein
VGQWSDLSITGPKCEETKTSRAQRPRIDPWLVGLHGVSGGPGLGCRVSRGFVYVDLEASAPSARIALTRRVATRPGPWAVIHSFYL